MGKIETEKSTVTYMIGLYCIKKHKVTALCSDCEQLKNYALTRLNKCPFGDEKTACKDCNVHCYKVDRREQIMQVMQFSGPRMLIYYPFKYLKHLMQKSPL
jgi:Nitrous oxide-stimulated promoter